MECRYYLASLTAKWVTLTLFQLLFCLFSTRAFYSFIRPIFGSAQVQKLRGGESKVLCNHVQQSNNGREKLVPCSSAGAVAVKWASVTRCLGFVPHVAERRTHGGVMLHYRAEVSQLVHNARCDHSALTDRLYKAINETTTKEPALLAQFSRFNSIQFSLINLCYLQEEIHLWCQK